MRSAPSYEKKEKICIIVAWILETGLSEKESIPVETWATTGRKGQKLHHVKYISHNSITTVTI